MELALALISFLIASSPLRLPRLSRPDPRTWLPKEARESTIFRSVLPDHQSP